MGCGYFGDAPGDSFVAAGQGSQDGEAGWLPGGWVKEGWMGGI